MKRGKLIIIEGSDASGKTTQLELLSDYLAKSKIAFSTFDFPQYHKTFFGSFVGRFLNGEFGHFSRINPYLAMFPYAGDRWQAKEKIYLMLNSKKIVLCNRYVPSISYQLAKVKPKDKDKFIKWCETLEYQVFGVPKEDLVIFLYVPLDLSQKLMEKRTKKSYMNGKPKDQYEKNVNYLKKVEASYLYLINKKKHWVKIDCVINGKLLPPEEIQLKIIKVLKDKKII